MEGLIVQLAHVPAGKGPQVACQVAGQRQRCGPGDLVEGVEEEPIDIAPAPVDRAAGHTAALGDALDGRAARSDLVDQLDRGGEHSLLGLADAGIPAGGVAHSRSRPIHVGQATGAVGQGVAERDAVCERVVTS